MKKTAMGVLLIALIIFLAHYFTHLSTLTITFSDELPNKVTILTQESMRTNYDFTSATGFISRQRKIVISPIEYGLIEVVATFKDGINCYERIEHFNNWENASVNVNKNKCTYEIPEDSIQKLLQEPAL